MADRFVFIVFALFCLLSSRTPSERDIQQKFTVCLAIALALWNPSELPVLRSYSHGAGKSFASTISKRRNSVDPFAFGVALPESLTKVMRDDGRRAA
jgi:hypothetical protein